MSKACQFAFVHNRGVVISPTLPPPHHHFPSFLNCKASNLTCLVCLCSCQRPALTAALHSCSSLSCEVYIDIQSSHHFRIYGKMVCPTNKHTHVQCSPGSCGACLGLPHLPVPHMTQSLIGPSQNTYVRLQSAEFKYPVPPPLPLFSSGIVPHQCLTPAGKRQFSYGFPLSLSLN